MKKWWFSHSQTVIHDHVRHIHPPMPERLWPPQCPSWYTSSLTLSGAPDQGGSWLLHVPLGRVQAEKNDSASNRHYDYMAKRCLFKWFLADNSGQRTNLIIGIYWDHLLVSDPGAKCKGIENDVRWWPNLKTWDFFQLRMHYDSHCLST